MRTDELGIAGDLAELSRTGRRHDIIRLLVQRLSSLTSVSVAAGGLVDESGSRLAVVRLGPAGWENVVVSGTDSGSLAEVVRTSRSVAARSDTDDSDSGITSAEPLMVDGAVIGSLGIGGKDLGEEDLMRLEELSALASLTLENAALHRRATRSVTETATVLSSLIESRDTYTESHCVALAEISVGVGIRMGVQDNQLTVLNLAGHLHDIGKVSLPDDVLLKKGPLDDDEFAVMKSHAAVGERVLSKIEYFVDVAPVVGQHHERFDGSGYPRGLSGEGILLEARILAVADAFDAMTSSRPYRPALPTAVAIQEIEDGAGSQFDPDVAAVFLHYLEGEQAQWIPSILR